MSARFTFVKWILFFDGDCAFCSRMVCWVARRDKRGRVDFAPLQGGLSREMGFSRHAEGTGGTMVLLRETDGAVVTRSDAVIELARALGGAWNILRLMKPVPRFLRDAVYQYAADRRHRLPWRNDACGLPDPRLSARLRE
jgi:predicted DCC family thiol-disulfide oxidoreductase YuxK